MTPRLREQFDIIVNQIVRFDLSDHNSLILLKLLIDCFEEERHKKHQETVNPQVKPRVTTPKVKTTGKRNDTTKTILKVLEGGLELDHLSIKTNVSKMLGQEYSQLSTQLRRMVDRGQLVKTEKGYKVVSFFEPPKEDQSNESEEFSVNTLENCLSPNTNGDNSSKGNSDQ
jgi:hypothetical protein